MGNVVPATLHNYLFRVLRCTQPTNAIVGAIAIGKRVVNLIYGHRKDHRKLNKKELVELEKVANAALNAYVRLIAVSKQETETSEPTSSETTETEPIAQ